MIDGFVWLERIKSREQLELIHQTAKSEDHAVFLPTHIIFKKGKCAGHFSIGTPGVPMVFGHLSTEQIAPRESFSLINSVENHVALNGATAVLFPLPKTSPFHNLMKSMGYKSLGEYTFFVKELVWDSH